MGEAGNILPRRRIAPSSQRTESSRKPDMSPANTDSLLDEALSRVSRLEAALAITGGTVHDVNNLLTVLSGNLFLLTESVRHENSLYQKMRQARNIAEKCGALMRELLTFSRGEDNGEQAICPANHISALEPLLQRSLGSGHRLQIVLPDERWSISASGPQLESAVTNLVINARDALGSEGVIRIKVENVNAGTDVAKGLDLESGEYVCIRVTDDGCGIPAEILPHIIEPLFTTKAAGNGTGLGLNMVQRFARNHGGTLAIESIEGTGTDVQVWLPRSDKSAELTANMTLPLSTLKSGDEVVLLISRDDEVRCAVSDILQTLGYSVTLGAMGRPVHGLPSDREQSVILVCDRTERNVCAEQQWIEALRRKYNGLKHVAVVTAGVDAEQVAPDADAYLERPISVIELANAMRLAAEK